MSLYLFQEYRHHTGLIQTQYCSCENHIHTHSSKYMHILFCLYWIQTCMYLIQTCLYDVCMCMYLFAHTYKISQLLFCMYVLKDTYTYKHAGSLMMVSVSDGISIWMQGSNQNIGRPGIYGTRSAWRAQCGQSLQRQRKIQASVGQAD